MLTVVETPLFQKQWPLYWTEEECGAFVTLYAKSKLGNLTGRQLKEIRHALEE